MTSAIQQNVTMVLLSGDVVDIPKFREILQEVMSEVIDGEPEMVDQDPVYSAAKGVAEFAKRAIFTQKERRNETNVVLELL